MPTEHGAPYPSPLNARNVPADIEALAEWCDDHAVYYATDAADRDSRFGSLPTGALVSSGDAGALWQKKASGWRTLFDDTGLVTTGFTAGSGFTVTDCSARRIGQTVSVYLRTTRSGADVVANSVGNISPDLLVVTIPPQFLPPIGQSGAFHSSGTTGGAAITTAGNLYIYDAYPTSTIRNGDNIDFTKTWMVS